MTLIPEDGAVCTSMAYRVTPATFEQLDYREKNGYLRFATTLDFGDGRSAEGLVYIATADNAAWLGPASDTTTARGQRTFDQVEYALHPWCRRGSRTVPAASCWVLVKAAPTPLERTF